MNTWSTFYELRDQLKARGVAPAVVHEFEDNGLPAIPNMQKVLAMSDADIRRLNDLHRRLFPV